MPNTRLVEIETPAGSLGLKLVDGENGVIIDSILHGSPLRLPSGRLRVHEGWRLLSIDGEKVKGDCKAAAEALSLPVHPSLSEEDIETIIEGVNEG